MKRYPRPVIPILLALILGIFIGDRYPGYREMGAAAGLFACGGILIFILSEKVSLFFPILCLTSLGYLSIQPWSSPQFHPEHIIHRADSTLYSILGVVEREPEEFGDQGAVLIINSICLRPESDDRRPYESVRGKIRVALRRDKGGSPTAHAGDTVLISARIRIPKNFNNPGGFDYTRYLAFEGIWAVTYISSKHLSVLAESSKNEKSMPVEILRKKISDQIDRITVNKQNDEVKGVLKALIIGYKSEIPPTLREAFNRTGVSHLLAISGLHMGIVSGVSFLIFAWILSRWDVFLWHAWTKKGAAILTFFPLFVYGVLSGMSPSTQRALIMVSVFLFSVLFQKEQDILNTLAVAALVILIIHPPALFSISFQLSFSAVFFIIHGLLKTRIVHSPETGYRERGRMNRIRTGLVSFFLVSIYATLGTFPLILHHFNLVSLISPMVNMIVVPIIGFLVVPLGLLSVLVFPITDSVSMLILNGAGLILSKGIDVVSFFSGWPFAAIKTVSFSFFEMLCYYVLVLTAFEIKRSGSVSLIGEVPSSIKFKGILQKIATGLIKPIPVKWIARVMLLLAFFGASVDILFWIDHRLWHDDLRITVMDVGKGNSILMELPRGGNILIDGGGSADNSIFDVGERVVAPLLWRKKITSLDAVILSHPNSDHLNGLIHVVKHFQVKELWTNGEEADTAAYLKFIQAIKDRGIFMPNFEDVPRFLEIHGVAFEVLYPPCDYAEKRKTEKWRRDNNNSFVIKAGFKTHTFLFPGDITQRAEKALFEEYGSRLKSLVLVSPHHGSNSSNTDPFLNAVDPQYVVFSSGGKGPHPAVMTRYHRRGAQLFSTDVNGAVSIMSDGASLKIETVKGSNLI
ncbi:MAG: DNA internalization-related competence protein ComEC/Rec2 [Thermodesulfobacteriota bacterium]